MAKVAIFSLMCYGNHDVYFVGFGFADIFDKNRLNSMDTIKLTYG